MKFKTHATPQQKKPCKTCFIVCDIVIMLLSEAHDVHTIPNIPAKTNI
jgi:hypothetical protein